MWPGPERARPQIVKRWMEYLEQSPSRHQELRSGIERARRAHAFTVTGVERFYGRPQLLVLPASFPVGLVYPRPPGAAVIGCPPFEFEYMASRLLTRAAELTMLS
jgi:hypothetical protein